MADRWKQLEGGVGLQGESDDGKVRATITFKVLEDDEVWEWIVHATMIPDEERGDILLRFGRTGASLFSNHQGSAHSALLEAIKAAQWAFGQVGIAVQEYESKLVMAQDAVRNIAGTSG